MQCMVCWFYLANGANTIEIGLTNGAVGYGLAKFADLVIALLISSHFISIAQSKAKKSEERKLLSSQMDSVDSDATEEIHETQRLNGNDKASKTERKSALFSSIQDVFTYARTGIQGFFDKNNPSSRRESKPRCDSDNEDEEPRVDMETHKVEELEDNHDEFTRQMTEEGGLKYQSSDNTVQQLSYQSLPPPLCLDTLPTSNSKS
ncbi:predicted protein [Nematostella vectensis]|uniref:Uncharacterized protein n=1 Tax=Nematostella vectensis TaxID=45351 RepID=A7SX97_NEMVE|nr:predicted protein [Nematostella vectensis]|eukprot:XP_001623767.1 predicted protein [Nematostella vectensis]